MRFCSSYWIENRKNYQDLHQKQPQNSKPHFWPLQKRRQNPKTTPEAKTLHQTNFQKRSFVQITFVHEQFKKNFQPLFENRKYLWRRGGEIVVQNDFCSGLKNLFVQKTPCIHVTMLLRNHHQPPLLVFFVFFEYILPLDGFGVQIYLKNKQKKNHNIRTKPKTKKKAVSSL